MNRLRFLLFFMAGGFVTKGTGMIAYHLFRPHQLLVLVTTGDPLGYCFADAVLPFFFDLRGIAPPAGAPIVFEILLAIGFAIQCFILGLMISEGRRLLLHQYRPSL